MSRPRVAVIEDNADNRLLLRALLRDRCELAEYASGLEGLVGLRAARPDVLLLDVSLPGMDGLEILRRIRADPDLHTLPVIALTAHAMSGDEERLRAVGFDAYLSKPIVHEATLHAALERMLAPGHGTRGGEGAG